MTITIKRIGVSTLRVETENQYRDYAFDTMAQAKEFVKKSQDAMKKKGHTIVVEGL